MIGRIIDTSNYVVSTSNILVSRIQSEVTSTSNSLVSRILFEDKSTSNILVDAIKNNKSSQWTTSNLNIYYNEGNVAIGSIDTSIYKLNVGGTVNATSYYLNGYLFSLQDTSNYVVSTCNILVPRIQSEVTSTCNILVPLIQSEVTSTSNSLIGRIIDTSNYVASASNILVSRIQSEVTYTSNILVPRIQSEVTSTCNILVSRIQSEVTSTSNLLVSRILFEDKSTSNILVPRIQSEVTSTSNLLVSRILFEDKSTSNILVPRIQSEVTSTSNLLVSRILFEDKSTSNILVPRIQSEVTSTSNLLVSRILFEDKSTSNILVPRIQSEVTSTCNILVPRIQSEVIFTSNSLIGRIIYTSNILIDRINDTSNIILKGVSELNTDMINELPDAKNKFIVNNIYNNNLEITGNLIFGGFGTEEIGASILSIYTDKIEAINTSNNSPAIMVQQKNTSYDIFVASNLNSNVFNITNNGDVNIRGIYKRNNRDVIQDTSNYVSQISTNVNTRIWTTTQIPLLDTAKITTGILSVERGGTGLSTITSGNILFGNGTGAIVTDSVLNYNNATNVLSIPNALFTASSSIYYMTFTQSTTDQLQLYQGVVNSTDIRYSFIVKKDNVSTEALTFRYNNIGIYTNTPDHPLDIGIKTGSYTSLARRYFDISRDLTPSTGSSSTVSLKATGTIWSTGAFVSSSDSRIKEDIQDINDDSSLQMILAIEPKTYKYIDKIEKTDNKVYGFIAQQVKEIFPDAVNIQKSYIPNIVLLADYVNKIITLPSQPTKVIIKNDDKIKCYDKDNNDIYIEVIEVINELTFKIKELEKEYTDTKIFVYGTQINDFHTLDKNYIFTLNVCATQELHRRIQSQQAIIQSQEDRIKDLEIKMTQILNNMPQ